MRKANRNNVELKNLTRESITQALLILMENKPYQEINVSDICKKAGVSRNAFYRNYPAKDAIIRRLQFEKAYEWRISLRKRFNILSIGELFTEILKFMFSEREEIKKYLNAGLTYLQIDVLFKSLRDLASAFTAPDYALCHLAGSIYAIYTYWISKPNPESPEYIALLICKLNHYNPQKRIMLPKMSDIDYLMTLDNFQYVNFQKQK